MRQANTLKAQEYGMHQVPACCHLQAAKFRLSAPCDGHCGVEVTMEMSSHQAGHHAMQTLMPQ